MNKKDNWISVKDALPELDRYGVSKPVLMVIAFDDYGKITTMRRTGWYEEGGRWVYCEDPWNEKEVDAFDAVTHWMPMDEAPDDITEDDYNELLVCHQQTDNAKEEKEQESRIFLDPIATVRLAGNVDDGVAVKDIVNNLPPDMGKAFKELVDIFVSHPDKMERCAEYATILDDFDKEMGEDNWGEFAPFFDRGSNWRDPEKNYIILRNYSEKTAKRLFNLGFSWDRKNGDLGGFGLFGEHVHIELENGEWIDAFDLLKCISFPENGRILKYTDVNYSRGE